MPTVIPMQDLPYFRLLVDLEETTYALTFRWNTREEAWYMDIAEKNATIIQAGIKIVPNENLTRKWADARMPSGDLVVYPKFANERIGRDSLFEEEVLILYFTEAEIEEIVNAV